MKQPDVYSKCDLTYNDYLKIPELLKLQRPLSEPAHHDEMLFIVIHQAYELWFKLILHELENSVRYMKEQKVLRARHFVNRSVEIMKVLIQQIHILETMEPVEFLQFRDRLNPASGFQSTQFRELEYLAGLKDERYLAFFKNRPDLLAILQKRLEQPDLRMTFYRMLIDLGFPLPAWASTLSLEDELKAESPEHAQILKALIPIYQFPDDHLPVYLLAESLVELDQCLCLWREHHVRVVERVIGMKRGTGGSSGVEYLKTTSSKKCFPLLWEVRSHLEKR